MGEIQKYQGNQDENNPYEIVDAELAKDEELANNLENAIQNDPNIKNELELAAYNQQKQLEILNKLKGDKGNVVINNNFYINNSVNDSYNSTDNSCKSSSSSSSRFSDLSLDENNLLALVYTILIVTLLLVFGEYTSRMIDDKPAPEETNKESVE
jgi:hypothetical protein